MSSERSPAAEVGGGEPPPGGESIRVVHAGGSYPVELVAGDAGAVAAAVEGAAPDGRLIVVSDTNVGPLYAGPLLDALRSRGRDARLLVVEAGEQVKTAGTLIELWNQAFESALDRGDTVVGVGGGVVCDLSGLLASTLMRGIGVVQVPTTVLAMADAAIGGKTGVNLGAGKNLVGTFHQPTAVIAWSGAIGTLSDRELRSGLAEVVKSAYIAGEAAMQRLERDSDLLVARDAAALTRAVRMAAALKARVVAEDERESGVRRVLNFGHTFGHCIEHGTGYGAWTHGESVSVGMVLALRFSERVGLASRSTYERLSALLSTLKLPVIPPSFTLTEWTSPIVRDKKRQGAHVQFIVGTRPGDVFARCTPLDELRNWLQDEVVERDRSAADPG